MIQIMLIIDRILIMGSSTLPLIILLLSTFCLANAETNGTESFFISPHGLGRTPEVDNALAKIVGQIRVKRTTYNHSSITYILDNVTIGMAYNDAKQTVEIPKNDVTRVSGGLIEFTYRFNYTKLQNRNNITGYAYGSVLSDSLTYTKGLTFCGGFICWGLSKAQGVQNLTIIQNRMKIKRMEPFNQSDLQNIEDMLDKVFTLIDPANFEVQILEIFNQIFPLALSDSLNHELFGDNIPYSFHSNTHGEMKMNIIHKVYNFGIDPQTGYRMVFVTEIQNWNEPICDTTVTLKPFSFEIYGGSQNFHLNCIYQSVVEYMHSNGWLDTVLNESWESDSFQFYAGDLFDLINNLYITFSPRAILDGTCVAQKEGLNFRSSRQFDANSFTLSVSYVCSLKGSNKEGSTAQILKFKAAVKLYIKVEATTHSLNFKIVEADIANLTFQPVGSYFINNIPLAMFKVNAAIRNVVNTFTFGTGFPTVTRQMPKTRVDTNYTLYYDLSHIGEHAFEQ